MIKNRLLKIKSPVLLAGLFLIVLLNACQTPEAPDEITLVFWQAIANDDLNRAKKYTSDNSQNLLKASSIDRKLKHARFSVGEIIINGHQAQVETTAVFTSKNSSTFTTFLIKQAKHWRVDYHRTQLSLTDNFYHGLFKSLKDFGDNLNKQLEKQLPFIEQGVESFAQELKQQLDKLGQNLEKALPPRPEKKNPYKNSI